MRAIIFTDLDGSLLDHEDYSFAAATQSLDRIKRSGIPLIMTTSKTRREVELLQREIGIREPFIVENGGGIFFPPGYRGLPIEHGGPRDGYTVVTLGTTYPRVRAFLERARVRFDLRGFGDMEVAEIAARTGLSAERAALAKEREFTEPFLMERPEEIEALSAFATADGFKVTRGGRFFHLTGGEQDKGKAVRTAYEIISRGSGALPTSIGIGDSENDLAMLAAVDIPVLIPRPGKGPLDMNLPGLIRAVRTGAGGWNDAVLRILDERMGPPEEDAPERQAIGE